MVITPRDSVRRRVFLEPLGVLIEVSAGALVSVTLGAAAGTTGALPAIPQHAHASDYAFRLGKYQYSKRASDRRSERSNATYVCFVRIVRIVRKQMLAAARRRTPRPSPCSYVTTA